MGLGKTDDMVKSEAGQWQELSRVVLGTLARRRGRVGELSAVFMAERVQKHSSHSFWTPLQLRTSHLLGVNK